MSGLHVGVDVGGTFTDLVALGDRGIVTAKVPSTPADQSEGVMNCLAEAGIDGSDVTSFAHGMTVATNALLERRGARTALITTEGFRDVIEIGRQDRPSLYDLTVDRPPQLVPRDLRITVRERVGPDGVVVDLDEASLDEVIRLLEEQEVEAVAVCLLFSFAYPDHESRIARALREALDGVHVSVSSEVLPEFREYERFSTTVADAYLGPKLGLYLSALSRKTSDAGIEPPLVMQSSGGVLDLDTAGRRAAACVLSGPAAGVVGAAYVASLSGRGDVLTFDMGGTSTDVAAVIDGVVQTTTESVVAEVPIKFPMVDVVSVSAGGGSIAWLDDGGAVRVGPRSAGADPGPVAYGRGGTEATVTDANVVMGFIAHNATLGGSVVIDGRSAREAIEALAEPAGLSTMEAAQGVIDVANAEMVRALRVVSVERGLDAREFVLVAFGGAGPLHACALAEQLGIEEIFVPHAGGILSALGLAIADLRRDYVQPMIERLDDVDGNDLDQNFSDMESEARSELEEPQLQRAVDMRYAGQSFELTIDATDMEAIEKRFHGAHEQRYGYQSTDAGIELVALRLTASVERPKPHLEAGSPSDEATIGTRDACFDGEVTEAAVLARDRMGAGSTVAGPAIVEFREATCVVRPGWKGEIDATGTLILERKS